MSDRRGRGGVLTELELLWAEHLSAPFPDLGSVGRVTDTELPYLDAAVAGFVSSYLADGLLDAAAVAGMDRSRHELRAAVAALRGEAAVSFGRLLRMTDLILGDD
ncbi:hypothetical protein [Nocardiopsis lucentensis]|uniref:hypothetical protein n=1 Tax=Nocardiopsis lucentensis TaxID=53441 RepID=UPI00034568A6|nr:hypothetical protein [Nocardiopsis lucentensis]